MDVSSGATVSFGYLKSENDKYRYQSAEFQFIGFDELHSLRNTVSLPFLPAPSAGGFKHTAPDAVSTTLAV